MIKTKIKFEEIQAGDLLEVVGTYAGVKSVHTGIAFESDTTEDEERVWMTSEGGNIVMQWDKDTIWRIDVKEVTFDDIRKGDLIQVTSTVGDTEQVVTGRASHLVQGYDEGHWWDSWDTDKGVKLCVRLSSGDVKIEILEREA